MFKSGKQFVLDESVLDLSSNTSAMPVNNNNHHTSSVSSMSSRHHHNGASLARNSSPFNGSDNDLASGGLAVGMSGGGGDFDSDLLSGEDGQGISQVKWTREKIAKLLDLYGKFRVKIEDPKYRKTEIWNKIAKALSDYDGITVIGKQCWDKFRYMKARYLRAREQKRRVAAGLINGTETSMITFPYFNELQELLGDTPFEQEASALGLGSTKREPTDTYDNVDVEDFTDQPDVSAIPNGGSKMAADNGEGYDDVGGLSINGSGFASPLNSNRRKRKFTSATNDSFDHQTASQYHSHLTSHPHDNQTKFSTADGANSFYPNLSTNGSSEAVGNALSSFMSAVIEMENRKLELFKRFVDLYEKRTAASSLPAMPNTGTPPRFKRSAPTNSYAHSSGVIGSRTPIPGKMSAPSSIGVQPHPNNNSSSNNNNNNDPR